MASVLSISISFFLLFLVHQGTLAAPSTAAAPPKDAAPPKGTSSVAGAPLAAGAASPKGGAASPPKGAASPAGAAAASPKGAASPAGAAAASPKGAALPKGAPLPPSNASPQIQQACKATRYPDVCLSTLSGVKELPPNPQPVQIIQAAIKLSQAGLKTSVTKLDALMQTSATNANLSNNIRVGMETMRIAEYRINSTAVAVTRGKLKTARSWMGAGVSYQSGSMTGLTKFLNDSAMVNETIQVLNSSIGIASNTLSMIRAYDLFGNQSASWDAPKTERDGYWEATPKQGTEKWSVQFPKGLKPDVTVCKAGCDFTKVQEAVDKAPPNTVTVEDAVDLVKGKLFVIWIKEGIYPGNVKVPFEKKNVVFQGDGIGKTVLTGNLNVNMPNVTTRSSPTLAVYGDGFMASNLTVENTANIDVPATAFLSDGDRTLLENCAFVGHQDTLFANSLRQYYKSCRIEGTVDFIFGNAAAIFQDCTILIRPRIEGPEKGESNTVTAHSRAEPAQVTGYVFQNCVLNGTDDYMKLFRANPAVHKNFLGRPWRVFSRTVFISCVMESIISPEGWTKWSGEEGIPTLYYGEFNSTGPGGNAVGRVPFSSKISPDHVVAYSLENFIQGSLV